MKALARQILHVCITVPDLDEALGFYRDVLGFTSVFETRNDDADGRLLGFDQDAIGLYAHHVLTVGADPGQATQINLVEFTNPKTTVADGPYREMNHVGITRLALAVDSVDDAFETVRTYPGVQIVCAPKDIVIREPEVTLTARWFSFTDPYGVFLTMAEAPKVS
jgi:catechol 2,3-dioxygenase-like lactoylglutathione lyase family enzyme